MTTQQPHKGCLTPCLVAGHTQACSHVQTLSLFSSGEKIRHVMDMVFSPEAAANAGSEEEVWYHPLVRWSTAALLHRCSLLPYCTQIPILSHTSLIRHDAHSRLSRLSSSDASAAIIRWQSRSMVLRQDPSGLQSGYVNEQNMYPSI